MPRVTAILSISLPPEMARQVEACCRSEHRTRSELIREALRAYLRQAEGRASWTAPPVRQSGAAGSAGRDKPRRRPARF